MTWRPEEDPELLFSKAADYAKLPSFRRDINIIDIVIEMLQIVLAKNAERICKLLIKINRSLGDSDAFKEALASASAVEIPSNLWSYVRKIRALPRLVGIEHCVFILAARSYELPTSFTAMDIQPLYKMTTIDEDGGSTSSVPLCIIPARKLWRCPKRGKGDGECDLIASSKKAKLAEIERALRGLEKKKFIRPDNDGKPKRYSIPLKEGLTIASDNGGE